MISLNWPPESVASGHCIPGYVLTLLLNVKLSELKGEKEEEGTESITSTRNKMEPTESDSAELQDPDS